MNNNKLHSLIDNQRKNITFSNDKDNIYKSIHSRIDDVFKFYLHLQDYIEELTIPKIEYSFLIKNMSIIYSLLKLSISKLDSWYDNGINEIRIINNKYFMEEFVKIYKENYYKSNISEMYELYVDCLRIKSEECDLFFSLICIPWKLEFVEDAYINILLIKELLDYIKKASSFISKEDKKDEKAD